MIEKTVVVSMMGEAEERPVAVLVQIASQYESQIHLVSDDKKINAKSIMAVMSLGVKKGNEVIITAEGEDEEEAIAEIQKVLEENL